MNLYNMLFGQNPNSDVLLSILGLKKSDVERFRDVWFSDEGISIYARTGGGNREDYPNEKLVKNPYYLRDEDDNYDSTYATYYFKFPDEIKEDCVSFKNIRENGISGKFIQWILKTIEREETETDKYHRIWNLQNSLVQQSTQTLIFETNWHTIVPLDESSLERYLKLMEEVGGEQLGYAVVPYKLNVSENVPEWNSEKNLPSLKQKMCRVKISIPDKWEIDKDMLERWKLKFGTKYPKAILNIDRMCSKKED